MSRPKYLKGDCQHCGGHLEFPVESIGMTVDCPHCGKATELMLAPPPAEPAAPRRWLVLAVAAILILVVGLVVCIACLNYYQKVLARVAARRAAVAAQAATNAVPGAAENAEDVTLRVGFQVSAITLEKAPDSSLVYAVGTLKNRANRQRFGVRVELDLLDAAGQNVGTAKDYQSVLEPNGEWRFKALVVDAKTVAAKVASIKEDQ
jgi:rRNA maturation protein Nop10